MLGAAGSPGKIGSELVLFTPGRADKARLQTFNWLRLRLVLMVKNPYQYGWIL